jgi:hypothetical protein
VRSWLRRTDTHLVAFDEHITSAQVVYQFSRFTGVRLRGDYRASTGSLRPQFLAWWTPSPGTVFYAGVQDDLGVDGFSPITGLREPGVRRQARTVFMKGAYLWRLTSR